MMSSCKRLLAVGWDPRIEHPAKSATEMFFPWEGLLTIAPKYSHTACDVGYRAQWEQVVARYFNQLNEGSDLEIDNCFL